MFIKVLLACLLAGSGFIVREEETAAEDPVPVDAGSMVLMEVSSGTVLVEKNAEGHYDPAGLTKMMGAWLAAEELAPEQYVVMSDAAFRTYDHSGGVLWIDTGEALQAEALIYASVLQSANDTTAMLAEAVSGDNDAFLARMNSEAQSLGMANTHYQNIFGLNNETHYSSAGDIAVLLRQALSNRLFREVFLAERYSIPATAKQSSTRPVVSDCASFDYSGEVGCEVGMSSYNGWSGAVYAERDDTAFIAVLMGEETRDQLYADFRKVLDHGFSHYRTVTIHHEEIEPKTVEVKRAGLGTAEVTLRCDQDFSVLLNADGEADLTAKIIVENASSGNPEDVRGSVVFTLNGEQVAEVPAVREVSYPEGAYSSGIRQYFDYFSILVLGGLILKHFLKYLSADHGA
ncbi:MAG: D-alanyl-D-alanine carboxypeptidase [Solobacterium sp.]|nr:D-alanyl-D-alanine carboxypeptidase [Solobacterium sp.]